MKFIPIAVATALSLPLSLFGAMRSHAEEPCQAYTLETPPRTLTRYVNTCPLQTGNFSIQGTFSNASWRVAIGMYEPAAYIYSGQSRIDGSMMRLIDFDVVGTTERPQYRFKNGEVTYVVTFRYSDPDTIRLEVYQNDRVILNELLDRESDDYIWR